MKRTINYIVAIAFATTSVSVLSLSTIAAEKKHEHAADEKVPEKLVDLWKAITVEHKEIVEFVAAKQLDKLDEPAHHLPPLLVALGKNKEVPAANQKRVGGMANNAIKAVEALHKAAHDKKEADVQSKFKTYEAVMKGLKAQFPGDVTGG